MRVVGDKKKEKKVDGNYLNFYGDTRRKEENVKESKEKKIFSKALYIFHRPKKPLVKRDHDTRP